MTQNVSWWQHAVIYQIYPRSYADSNGDGVGDLKGIISKIDYLQWLGVDAIWLSPVFPSPMLDHGYDVANYIDIDPLFGNLDDMDTLIDSAHNAGIKVLLDLVPNHTSDQHPWFLEARSSRDNPKRDWYIWHDGTEGGGLPNNWLSYFGGPAWTWDDTTGQYYLHNFAPQQPELNWRNPEVEAAMHEQIRFWLERGVDGFRMDVIDRIIKDADFTDNPPTEGWQRGDNTAFEFKRIYSEQRPEVIPYFKRLRDTFNTYDNRVIVGELAYDATLDKIVTYYGDKVDESNGDGLHLPFNFQLIETAWNAIAIKDTIDAYESALPDFAIPSYVLGNHDVSRIATRVGVMQARVAAMLLLTLRGAITLYYGDEIGMTDVNIPERFMQDPQGTGTGGFVRDKARTPMQWAADAPSAGFCAEGVTPWLPLPEDAAAINVETEQEFSGSMLNLYHKLLKIRRETPALCTGRYVPMPPGPYVYSYVREDADSRYLVVLNMTGSFHTIRYEDFDEGYVIASTYMDGYRKSDFSVRLKMLDMRPDEGLIIRLVR